MNLLNLYEHSLLTGTPVIAKSAIDSVNEAIRSNRAEGAEKLVILLGIACLVLGATAVVYFVYSRRVRRVVCDPAGLFKELSRAHRLSRRQSRLLNELVRSRDLDDPCKIFMDSSLWILDPVKEPKLCKPKCRARVQELYRKFFKPDAEPYEAAA